MNTEWIVVANPMKAKIYLNIHHKNDHHLTLLLELNNSKFSPKPYQSKCSKRLLKNFALPDHDFEYIYSNEYRPASEFFARQVADFLHQAKIKQQFHLVTLVTTPHFSNDLKKHLPKKLEKSIESIIEKNSINISQSELEIIAATKQAMAVYH